MKSVITPNFILIGAMKSATSTIHEQLSRSDEICMLNPKEPNFFSDDDIYKLGPDYYNSLGPKTRGDFLIGESSTHYTKLPTYPDTVSRMIANGLTNTKFIYCVRHPIDRLISQYTHEWSQRLINCDINRAIEDYPSLIEYSKYNFQITPYLDNFEPSNILVVFFERVIAEPQRVLNEICTFLNLKKPIVWNSEVGRENAGKARIRRFPFHEILIESRFMSYMRQTYIPKSFRQQIREIRSNKKKPVLNSESLAFIERELGLDLLEFGKKFGLQMTLENYREVSSKTDCLRL